MNKKALAIMHSPKSLRDFVWYYVTYGQDYEWDAMILSGGYNKENADDILNQFQKDVEASGIFGNLIVYDGSIEKKNAFIKSRMLLGMMIYAILGKQEEYCKNKISKVFDYSSYDIITIPLLDSLFSGFVINLAEDVNIIIMEDGMSDYFPRYSKWSIDTIRLYGVQRGLGGYILARMGYCDPAMAYEFKPTEKCIKFAENPKRLKYQKYKRIMTLNDRQTTGDVLYKKYIRNIYEARLPQGVDEIDIALFTTNLSSSRYFLGSEAVEDIVRYIEISLERSGNNNIIIKKHPADNFSYLFSSRIKCFYIEQNVPGEILFDIYSIRKSIFCWSSTLISSAIGKSQITVLHLSKFDSQINGYRDVLQRDLEGIGLDDSYIVDV